jgi:hypothetical protein
LGEFHVRKKIAVVIINSYPILTSSDQIRGRIKGMRKNEEKAELAWKKLQKAGFVKVRSSGEVENQFEMLVRPFLEIVKKTASLNPHVTKQTVCNRRKQ